MNSDNLIKYTIIGFLVLFGIKAMFSGDMFHSDQNTGNGYSIKFPKGWAKNEQLSSPNKYRPADEPQIITYSTPELNPKTNTPVADITILTVKPKQAMWIEDDIEDILNQILRQRNKILDKGEIKIDKRICKWVLYQSPKPYNMLNFDFYTVDDSNVLFKLQYSADPKNFQTYRADFEAAKESLKFSHFSI